MSSAIVLTILMVATGFAGGTANYLLNGRSKKDLSRSHDLPFTGTLSWWGYAFIGIVATFIVPLFLSLLQSNLFDAMFESDGLAINKVFIFTGFCLIAAISSRAFIETISDRVLALARQASRTAEETKKELGKQEQTLEELVENADSQSGTGDSENEQSSEERPHQGAPNFTSDKIPGLSPDEISVLNALKAKPYTRRTLKGVAADSHIDMTEARKLLGKLIQTGLAREIKSKKTGNLLYGITAEGDYVVTNQN